MNISDISKSPWHNLAAREALPVLVMAVLRGEPGLVGTTALLAKLGVDMRDQRGIKNILAHLANTRKDGSLAGWFSEGKPTMGTNGHPSIKWHNNTSYIAPTVQVRTPIAESILDIHDCPKCGERPCFDGKCWTEVEWRARLEAWNSRIK